MVSFLKEKILALKREKEAVILAHYYQEESIQELADFVGDSLALSQKAAQCDAPLIVLAGVHFMAETAKILNPTRKILVPDLEAGCSLAESCPPEKFRAFVQSHPDHVVVTYINCSAEIKAMSDYVCTSSNALQVIGTLPFDQPIIFAPDRNLGHYLNQVTGRSMLLWDGACVVHEAFSFDKLMALHREYPEAAIIAHPESEAHILKTAAYIGSTAGMIDFVIKSDRQTFIVATEVGILVKMQQQVPGKLLIPAPAVLDNTCACSECAYMKVNTLQKLCDCLLHESPQIEIAEDLRKRALAPISRMLEIS